MSLYESLVKESTELYRSLPDEGNRLFTRRYVPIDLPESMSSESGIRPSNDYKLLPMKFDAVVSSGEFSSNSKAISIFDAGSEGYMSAIRSRIYTTGDDKYSSFVNAFASKAIVIDPSKTGAKKLNIFISTGSDICVQLFITSKPESSFEITEWYSSSESEGSISGSINEIVAEPYSDIHLNVVHNEPNKAKVLNFSKIVAKDNSSVTANYVYLGGAVTKANNQLIASGHSSNVYSNELIIGQEKQKYDISTSILNESHSTNTRLTSKAVVSNEAICFLKGFSKINHGAKDAKSFVEERGLIIDKGAKIESIPSMSIDEGQVKASHSSAMAPLDEEMTFYLTSRGIEEHSARALIVNGFSISQIAKIKDEILKVALSSIITSRSKGMWTIGSIPKVEPGNLWVPTEMHEGIQKHNDLLV